MHAQNDYAGRMVHLARARRNLDAAQLRHPDVQDNQVGSMLLAETRRLQSVTRFSDHRQAGGLEQAA